MKTNRFARKGCDRSFTDIKSHALFKAPVLRRINVGLEKFAIMNITNITIYFKSSAKKRYLQLEIASQISLMNMLKTKGPKVDPCGTPSQRRKKKGYQKYEQAIVYW
jgi:hypothetical protein